MTRHAPGAGGWVVSPAFDLLFLANVLWPLAFLPGFVSDEGTPHVEFWQLYFLTTPHRWITLVLVAADPDRREGRGWLFAALAALAAALVGGVWLCTGAFTCLLLVDFLWNGWHFASQHHGVLRVYARKAGGGRPRLERWGLRLFICYVIARVAAWSTGWLEDYPHGLSLVRALDLAALAVPGALLGLELLDRPLRPGKLTYLASVCGLYSALLLALRGGHATLALALAAASAVFHAVEYLALVTHYAWRRRQTGSDGLFRAVAVRWLTALAAFAVGLGVSAWLINRHAAALWAGLTIWASLLHYAYDGMIWKLRRPETARALGAV